MGGVGAPGGHWEKRPLKMRGDAEGISLKKELGGKTAGWLP